MYVCVCLLVLLDEERNDCSLVEEKWDEEMHAQNYVYTRYAEGSIVWARMSGYPWLVVSWLL